MTIIRNPWRGAGLPDRRALAAGEIETDPAAARGLFAQCPAAAPTPLVEAPALAAGAGIARIWVKDERARMGLGSFKALGAAHAIAKLASSRGGAADALSGETFVCASAGNHGLSLAAGARLFGAEAVIYLAETVPSPFAARLEAKGARVVRAGADYEASAVAAVRAAEKHGWRLLPDSSWEGCVAPARDVMEGYLIMGAEVAEQIAAPPSHVFLQAGVGGLAAAGAAMARRCWGGAVRLIVVEPAAAPALTESVRAGRAMTTPGPASSMGRLDCKTPSHLALDYLAREADGVMTVTDGEAEHAARALDAAGFATTPSGAAGYAGLLAAGRGFGLSGASEALIFVTEVHEEG